MANTRKKKSERKISKSFAVKQKVYDEFYEILEIKGLVPSNVVEELIIEFNEKN